MLHFEHSGFRVVIGQNQADNVKILQDAEQNDLWCHINEFSSSHAIVRNPDNIRIPNKTKRFCCLKIKQYNNKCKNMQALSFCISRVNNIVHIGEALVDFTNMDNVQYITI